MNRTVLKHFAEWAREALLAEVGTESLAYAWFSRLIALRYMAVNGYLPEGSEDLSKGCQFLTSTMPFIFEEVSEKNPDADTVMRRFCRDIPDADLLDNEEIIGWLHQYYNGIPKDETYALLKQNVKISKDRVPSVTQLFTPHWIVRYMVENSLGRLWLESHPDSALAEEMPYYVPEKNAPISSAKIEVERIRFLDPCMGSGNILIYAFDLLMKIYREQGYAPTVAARMILEKNLFGLDIDLRAEHLASFVLLMKARKYDPDIFSAGIVPRVCAIAASNDLVIADGCSRDQRLLKEAFLDADEYGSILAFPEVAWNDDLPKDFSRFKNLYQIMTASYDVVVTNPPYMGSVGMDEKLGKYVKQHYPDAKEDLFAVFIERCSRFTRPDGYYALITQPSLLFLSSFAALRKKMVHSDTILSLLHLGRGIFGVDFGSVSFVLRRACDTVHVGEYFRLHERNFQYLDADDIGTLFLAALKQPRLHYDFRSYDTKTGIVLTDAPAASAVKIRYRKRQADFLKLPGIPLAYWVSDAFSEAMESGVALGTVADSRQGLATTDNKRYLRYWFEVPRSAVCFGLSSTEEAKATGGKWFPYNKGGEYRKWYGNLDYVVDYSDDGKSIKENVLRKYPYLKTPDFVV
ncbi:MAG: BREX-1 system adenine-specific DNA-methyltransferase PglX, partial [Firmicutes bacterium]|nr:BREX-1 system adenine-specific DNA-methyltransferase PglX [Bacillota bacterium]